MIKIAVLTGVMVVCVGCASAVERAGDRLRPVVRQAIAEAEAYEDQKMDVWRDLRTLTDKYGCSISVGARLRATEAERAELDALSC